MNVYIGTLDVEGQKGAECVLEHHLLKIKLSFSCKTINYWTKIITKKWSKQCI